MNFIVGDAGGDASYATLSAGVAIDTVDCKGYPEGVIGVGVDRGKGAMAGITGTATAMPHGGPDQAAVCAVALSAGVMDLRVIGVNGIANRRMAAGAIVSHGDKGRVVGSSMLDVKYAMAIGTSVRPHIASRMPHEIAISIMAGYATFVFHRIGKVDWHAAGIPGRSSMAGGTFRGHANLSEMANGRICPLMDGKPSNAMAGRAVPASKLASC